VCLLLLKTESNSTGFAFQPGNSKVHRQYPQRVSYDGKRSHTLTVPSNLQRRQGGYGRESSSHIPEPSDKLRLKSLIKHQPQFSTQKKRRVVERAVLNECKSAPSIIDRSNLLKWFTFRDSTRVFIKTSYNCNMSRA
jgi:hypothetical protein